MKFVLRNGMLILALVSIASGISYAQMDKEILAELVVEEQEAVNALLLYPSDVRDDILASTQYPEALIKIERIQSKTSKAFQILVQDHPLEVQKMIWDLTRYPGLIQHLANNDVDVILVGEQALNNFPEVIHSRAKKAAKNYQSLIRDVEQLEIAADFAFESILTPYSSSTQEALLQLIELPEVMTILTGNIELTILVGDFYRTNPEWVMKKVDSLHLEVARQQAEELNNWKERVEDDPQILEEYEAASTEFAETYDYDDAYYDWEEYPYEDADYSEYRSQHYYYHYPYWFGYPYWYGYPCWRPYPYWHDWGFYRRSGHHIVIIDLPSLRFTHWYFHHGHHHFHWPVLSAAFVRHYHRYPRRHGSITISVKAWQDRHANLISMDWLKDDGRLPQRFAELGRFEINLNKYNARNPGQPMSEQQFIARYRKRYLDLAKAQTENVRQGKVVRPSAPSNQVTIAPSRRPDEVKDRASRKTIEKSTLSKVPRVKSGKDYHRDKWERTKPTTNKKQTRTAPIGKSVKPKVTPKSSRKAGLDKGTPKTKPRPKKIRDKEGT